MKSFLFAANGLRYMLRYERNARLHLAAAAIAVVAGVALDLKSSDWRWIVAAIGWVCFAEAVNTALERLCDVVTPAPSEVVRITKDVAAGAVLISAAGAGCIGVLTVAPYIALLLAGNGLDSLLWWLSG